MIRTPDQRLRVFISSTLKELADERQAAREAILELHLTPVMFDGGARPHPAQELYQSYLLQSQIFVGVYWQSYGWIGPDMSISGLEDEYNLSDKMPRLIYIKDPAPHRDAALKNFLDRIREDNASCYTSFSTPTELSELIKSDLALVLTEHFEETNHTKQSQVEHGLQPPSNVPVPRNPLINRKKELEDAHSLLLQADSGLLTLTGAGGAGKSRLAIQIGIEMRSFFEDGVYLVRLEDIRDTSLVIPTIADTVGIHATSGSRPVDEMLVEFLREKQALLILDNFEQLVEAAPAIAGLLESCSKLKCVATSRVPLRLRAERVILVPPLAVAPPDESSELNGLSQYAAVELFLQRAQAVKQDFVVTNDNASTIAEICYRLDGLPLAIELAAARIRILTPQEILGRLANRFDLLRNGPRDLPERQRTLRDAIDWSYELLNDFEKKLFRRLSIFTGGWTVKAARVVCDLQDDVSSDLFEDALTSLLDYCLIIPLQEVEDSERFGMLSTIHEYAAERLEESGEDEMIRRQHARYYLDFISMVESRIRSSERAHWQQVMQKEFGNLRGVMEWITSSGQCLEIGQQLMIKIGVLWVTSGFFVEGVKWCSRILSLSSEATPVTVRAGLLGIAGLMAWAQGDCSTAQTHLDESLSTLEKTSLNTAADKFIFAQALITRGIVALTWRDLETAASTLQRSLHLFEEVNDQWYEAIAYSWLGEVAIYRNDRERGRSLQEKSINLARAQGDPWCLVPALMSSAQVAVVDRDLSKSYTILLEAIDLLRKTGDKWSLSFALNEMGHVMLMEGEYNQASSYFIEGLTLSNTLGNIRTLVVSLAGAAALITQQPLNLSSDHSSDPSGQALAACLCGATAPYIDQPGIFIWLDTKLLYEESIAQVKLLLDREVWDRNYYQGQSMPLAKATGAAIQSLRNIFPKQSAAKSSQ